ncbi:MAG: hypothetical protein WCF18_25390 [Chthoniobacteraceae bacterium]
MKIPYLLATVLCAVPRICFAIEPISPAAETLEKVFDSMHVEEHWPAGVTVDWRTGEPTGKAVSDDGKHTHCSQFAAATCERLGVYLLRPPEHSAVLLANAQFDWLPEKGADAGWRNVANGVAAQDLANKGMVVVAVYKNHDPKKSGHIAIVRPGKKTEAQIAAEGPDVIQAGGHNYNCTSLKQGFANHPSGFAKGEIRFYAHSVALPAGNN